MRTSNHDSVRLSQQRAKEERRFVCDICDKAFRDAWNLKVHRESRVHREKPVYECKLCSVVCPKPSVLRKHEATRRHRQRIL